VSLQADIPTRLELELLMEERDPASVSIYLATDPRGGGDAERIELKNLGDGASAQLRAAGCDKTAVALVSESLADLVDDDALWSRLANSLAVFATPATLKTFRLPNRLSTTVQVADRFHLKPLLRSVTFPQSAFVLALAQGSARLLEIGPEGPPVEVGIDGLPQGVSSSDAATGVAGRSQTRRIRGAEGKKVRIRQYAREVDRALRSVLAGLDLPLILASTEPVDAIFRSVNTYPHLAAGGIPGSPEGRTDAELAAAARTVLDGIYAQELRDLAGLFETRASQDRTTIDTAEIARAATFGAVDTLFVDIDAVVPGVIDEETGAVTFVGAEGGTTYGVFDEVARRVLINGGRVLAVRAEDVPGAGHGAAILRYRI
jgi:hypothetical protein